ncbi:MAG: hypothetical protein ACUVWR_08465 [Anaerolineae bacterium]
MPPRGLCEWETVVSSHMPYLSKPQVKVLALSGFAMAMTRSFGLAGIACFLCELLGRKQWALRQQLREWNYAAADKAGKQRRAVAGRGVLLQGGGTLALHAAGQVGGRAQGALAHRH